MYKISALYRSVKERYPVSPFLIILFQPLLLPSSKICKSEKSVRCLKGQQISLTPQC